MKRYLDDKNISQWKIFIQNKLKPYGNKLIFECEIDKRLIDKISENGTFLNDVLQAWSKIKQAYDVNKMNIAKKNDME